MRKFRNALRRPAPALVWEPGFAVFRPNRAMRRAYGDLGSALEATIATRQTHAAAVAALLVGVVR